MCWNLQQCNILNFLHFHWNLITHVNHMWSVTVHNSLNFFIIILGHYVSWASRSKRATDYADFTITIIKIFLKNLFFLVQHSGNFLKYLGVQNKQNKTKNMWYKKMEAIPPTFSRGFFSPCFEPFPFPLVYVSICIAKFELLLEYSWKIFQCYFVKRPVF